MKYLVIFSTSFLSYSIYQNTVRWSKYLSIYYATIAIYNFYETKIVINKYLHSTCYVPVSKQQSQDSNPDNLLHVTQVRLQLQTFPPSFVPIMTNNKTIEQKQSPQLLMSIVAGFLYWIYSTDSYDTSGE